MLQLVVAILLLVAGAALLLAGADWFLDGASELARALGVSAVVIGVLLAGLEPEEMLTAAIASARGAPGLAVGNVIGTNITITTVAVGISALIFPLSIDRGVRRQALAATLVSLLPIALLFTHRVTRPAGVLLLILFIGYTIYLFCTDRETIKRISESEVDDEREEDEEHEDPHLRWKTILQTFGGLIAMAVGGPAIVEGALRLSAGIGLSQAAIGATIVSLGTGAEMIVLGVSAARTRRSGILIGGILGSFAYNLLVTLGLAAAIHPISIETPSMIVALSIMIAVHLLLLGLIWYGKFPRVAGSLLIVAYLAYLVWIVLA